MLRRHSTPVRRDHTTGPAPTRMRGRVLGAAVALCLALTACGGEEPAGGDAAELDTITLGLIPIIDVAPVYLGMEQGFFEDAGIQLELSSGQGGAAIVPGVVSGNLDIGFGNNVSILVAAATGLPIRVVTSGVYGTGEVGNDYVEIMVAGGSPVTSAAELAGKTVAVNTLNAIGGIAVGASVASAGGDPAAVNYVEMPFPNMNAALESGQVDAIWQVEPFVALAKRDGHRVLADPLIDMADQIMVSTYFASEQFTAENRELVERFRTAIDQSLTYAQEHPQEVRAIIPTYLDIPEDLASELVLPRWTPEIDRGTFEVMSDLALKDGLIDSKPDLNAILPE
ncbi:ABC transporter substrate-binding protein [Pseudonocardia sichuanensis]